MKPLPRIDESTDATRSTQDADTLAKVRERARDYSTEQSAIGQYVIADANADIALLREYQEEQRWIRALDARADAIRTQAVTRLVVGVSTAAVATIAACMLFGPGVGALVPLGAVLFLPRGSR